MARASLMDSCCGVCEFNGCVGSPEYILDSFYQVFTNSLTFRGAKSTHYKDCTFVIFTATSRDTLDKLHKYIVTNKLGSMIKTKHLLNKCHGPSYITVGVWTWDKVALTKWYEKRYPIKKITNTIIGSYGS